MRLMRLSTKRLILHKLVDYFLLFICVDLFHEGNPNFQYQFLQKNCEKPIYDGKISSFKIVGLGVNSRLKFLMNFPEFKLVFLVGEIFLSRPIFQGEWSSQLKFYSQNRKILSSNPNRLLAWLNLVTRLPVIVWSKSLIRSDQHRVSEAARSTMAQSWLWGS